MKVYCVRHTEVDKISSDWIAGKTEVLLTPKGENQADTLASELARHTVFDSIFTSPMKRCLILANKFRNLTQQDYTIDERLAECDFGQWEGQRLNHLYEQNPEIDLFNPPGGESIEAFSERVFAFWNEVVLKLHAKNVLILAHGGTNSALLMKLTQSPLATFWDKMQSYGGVNEIEVLPDGSVTVHQHNDTRFVDGGA